jgi:transcriptional regulator with XRE-family HTH domain
MNPQQTVRDLGGYIRDARQQARMSLRKLSELAGVSNPYLSQIERGLRRPSAKMLQAIASGLRISAETLYVQAGILDDHDSDVVRALRSDPGLTQSQRDDLCSRYTEALAATAGKREKRRLKAVGDET